MPTGPRPRRAALHPPPRRRAPSKPAPRPPRCQRRLSPPGPAALPRLPQLSPLRARLSAGSSGAARRRALTHRCRRRRMLLPSRTVPGRPEHRVGPVRCVGPAGPVESSRPCPGAAHTPGAGRLRPGASTGAPSPGSALPRLPRPAPPFRGHRAGAFAVRSRGSPGRACPGLAGGGRAAGASAHSRGVRRAGGAGAEPSPRPGLPGAPGAAGSWSVRPRRGAGMDRVHCPGRGCSARCFLQGEMENKGFGETEERALPARRYRFLRKDINS